MAGNPLIDGHGKHRITKEVLTDEDIRRRQVITSMRDPEHLKTWLKATGLEWLVMNSMDLVDSLWPAAEGSRATIESLIDLIYRYTDHRRTIDSGRREHVVEPLTGERVEIVVYKDQRLEPEELDRAIRFLAAQIYEVRPDWKLEDPAL